MNLIKAYVEDMIKINGVDIAADLKKYNISLDWFYTLPDNTANDLAWNLDNLHFMLYVLVIYNSIMSSVIKPVDEYCDNTLKYLDMLEEIITLLDNKNDVKNILKIARIYRKYITLNTDDEADAFLNENGVILENAIKDCSDIDKDKLEEYLKEPVTFFMYKALEILAKACTDDTKYDKAVGIIKMYWTHCPI